MLPLVSVIIPIFNAEKTLSRCMESVIKQTMNEIEIICVDDGSTDNSGKICDDYAKQDARITVIHQPNKGVSAARNAGMARAKGKYLAFVDSDDFVSPFIYEAMYNAALRTQAKMVVCDFTELSIDGEHYIDQSSQTGDFDHIIKNLFSWEIIVVWNRLIINKPHCISFNEKIRYSEDRLFVASLISTYRTDTDVNIAHLPKSLYYYDTLSNPISLTKQNKKLLLVQTLNAYERIYQELNDVRYSQAYYSFVLELASSAFWSTEMYELSEDEYQSVFQPFSSGIRKNLPNSAKKRIVLSAINNSYQAARRIRWQLYPRILIDKLKK